MEIIQVMASLGSFHKKISEEEMNVLNEVAFVLDWRKQSLISDGGGATPHGDTHPLTRIPSSLKDEFERVCVEYGLDFRHEVSSDGRWLYILNQWGDVVRHRHDGQRAAGATGKWNLTNGDAFDWIMAGCPEKMP